ncbi:MAG: hypothetical protein WB714_10975, partial [Candidatus Sulfotelmatobacter sp.]
MTHDLLQALDSTSGSVLNNSPERVFEDGARCSEIKIQLRDPRVAAALVASDDSESPRAHCG